MINILSKNNKIIFIFLVFFLSSIFSFGEKLLHSQSYIIEQTWSQENNYNREYHVKVPSGEGPFPVLIILHGSGGQGQPMLRRFSKYENYILIAPDGYDRQWNVSRQRSKAPDVDFIKTIIDRIQHFSNVDNKQITIIGMSNGSALLNRLMIELDLSYFQSAISVVSQLVNEQYHDDCFWYNPSGNNNYDKRIIPAKGRRLLTISGENDPIIPYNGGKGVVGYTFLPAEKSAFIWAKVNGYIGKKLTVADSTAYKEDPLCLIFNYVKANVMHVKVLDHGHDASRAIGVRKLISGFIEKEF